ncbi:type II toxin-antitoxin system RelE/ParE family toxin [Rhizobium sp. SSA_523]|uniref:type II toxin-antitoxin system RelE/ParE family toxin n=1 Tax=Rhizobium sp. SSA_523 TaxID=2952477 RepID=UPI0020917F08|nr:type II toxin-antitoxin system RelE/ParE family toxin [Rhizobium sp. SSA_523]MCO5733184.1 type II toxin-antitoxin system RelE/ParE family toxin [Rhizobium sp. SSA_523]WKC24054.1 type II toxin-antitoxin system RelE/ParE family toxin [Rhizobium sp. SSA_523]
MIVHWTLQAVDDRASIFDYLLGHNPSAALAIDQAFEQAARRLQDFPRCGKIGVITGTRELIPYPNYRLVYEVSPEAVRILTILHTARQWPPATPA